MTQVEECLEALKEAIVNSEEYQAFLKSSERLSKYPEKMRQTNEFRKRNYILQNTENDGRLFEEIDSFAKEFEEFRKDPMVDEFLVAELHVCRMVQRIFYELADVADMQLNISEIDAL